jgi:hypothetical protein
MARKKMLEGQKRRTLNIRLDDDEYAEFKSTAKGEGMPIGTLIRSLALKGLRRSKAIEAAADPVVRLSGVGSAEVHRARRK